VSERIDLASAIEWIGTVGAAGWWALTGVRREYPDQGIWLEHTSYTNLLIGSGLLVAALIARRYRTGRFLRKTPFDIPMLLFLLGAVVGWSVSYDHDRNLLRFFLLLSAVAFFYLLADSSTSAAQRFVASLVLLAVILAISFLIQHDFESQPVKFELSNRIGLLLTTNMPDLGLARIQANPNVAAGIAALAMPFSISASILFRRLQRYMWMVIAVLVTVFLTLGILVTSSRGAIGALVSTGALWVIYRGGVRIGGRKMRAILFLIAVSLGLGLYGFMLTRADVLGSAAGGTGRAALYHDALYLGRDYSLTGAGLGAYPMVYASYSLLSHVGFIPHSHHWYLQVWLEQGVLGSIAILWMVAVVIWLILWVPTATDKQLWHISAAGWSSMILLVHGLVDAPLYRDDQSMLLFLPFGLMVAGRSMPEKSRWEPQARRRVLVLCIALALGLVAATLIWQRPILSVVFANFGAVQQTQIELKQYSWPEWSIQDEVRRQADLGRPIRTFQRALAYDPHNATANRRLGMIALSRADYAEALEHLRAAYARTPGDNATRELLGEAYIVNGHVDEGVALWTGVNNVQGQLDIRAWWYSQIGDVQRFAWVQDAVRRVSQ
jgi:O-antigen ligase